jgi:hypothetical protein
VNLVINAIVREILAGRDSDMAVLFKFNILYTSTHLIYKMPLSIFDLV